ncbi:hypothetical protein RQP46_001457 [Phenoliferia psychrophenolica]
MGSPLATFVLKSLGLPLLVIYPYVSFLATDLGVSEILILYLILLTILRRFYIETPGRYSDELADQYGDTFDMGIFGVTVIWTRDPGLVQRNCYRRSLIGDIWKLWELRGSINKAPMKVIDSVVFGLIERALARSGPSAKAADGDDEGTLLDALIQKTRDPAVLKDQVLNISFALFNIQRRTGLWGKDALEFDPDRWLDERISYYRENPFIWTPFSAGPRLCLGQQFGTQLHPGGHETRYDRIELALDVQPAHSITNLAEQELLHTAQITLMFKDGLWVRLGEAKA